MRREAITGASAETSGSPTNVKPEGQDGLRHKTYLLSFCVLAVSMLTMLCAGRAAADTIDACGSAAPGHARCAAEFVRGGASAPARRLASERVARVRAHDSGPAGQPSPLSNSPQWLQEAYDLTWLSANRGQGDTIAIVDAYDDPAAASDLTVFRQAYGLPACTQASGCLTVVNQGGAASPLPAADASWDREETLDLQAASAICPNCRLLLVEANSTGGSDLQQAMQTAVNLGANQISDSWWIQASTQDPTYPASFLTPRPGAALPAVVAASGDTGGAAAGDAAYPAALPDVTAVGGTTLDQSASVRGFSESPWSSSGFGCVTGETVGFQSGTGCAGRAYSDVSADADPNTGLEVYEAADGGWARSGGTSLATPIVAAYEALTGVNGQSPVWAYQSAADLNTVSGGSYAGSTGVGSISGDVVAGAPSIAGDEVLRPAQKSIRLTESLYTNGAATQYFIQYGTTTAYGHQTAVHSITATPGATVIHVRLTGLTAGTGYHARVVAFNATGRVYGYDIKFATRYPS